ncbi:MAG: hypothetical protein RQ891_09690, partial [Thermoflexus sp.]|nr:hypothetical protein [Thermoflexus sp.]
MRSQASSPSGPRNPGDPVQLPNPVNGQGGDRLQEDVTALRQIALHGFHHLAFHGHADGLAEPVQGALELFLAQKDLPQGLLCAALG